MFILKKNSSKFIAFLVAALILVPNIAVSAETNTSGSKLSNALGKQQQRIENMQQRQQKQQMKPALTEKKDIIKKNHETNKALREEIAQKRVEVKSIYKDIIQNHKTLTPEDLSKIDAQIKVIQTESNALEATKGTIKAESEQVKSAVKSNSLDEALAHLDKIISIQNFRTESLGKLDTEMGTLISILKTASGNSTPSTEAAPLIQTEPTL